MVILFKKSLRMVEDFFSDFEFQGIVDTTSVISLECLWYCFTKVLQKELDSGKRAVEHTQNSKVKK